MFPWAKSCFAGCGIRVPVNSYNRVQVKLYWWVIRPMTLSPQGLETEFNHPSWLCVGYDPPTETFKGEKEKALGLYTLWLS